MCRRLVEMNRLSPISAERRRNKHAILNKGRNCKEGEWIMKKLAVLLAAAIVLFGTVYAGAENATEEMLSQLNGQLFEFYSGVGAWSTELTVGENGVFSGNFHDSEMGETGDNYPDGTLYGCSFHGRFSDPEPVDEYTWTAKVSVEQDEGQVPEAIEDGIRYVTATPYGLEKAQAVTIFLPGTPVDHLPEGFMFWSHLQEIDPEAKSIPYYAIWNEADEAGFITAAVSEMQDKPGTSAVTNETGSAARNAENTEGETAAFERKPGLPTYTYSGDDLIEGAIADYLAANERANEYLTEPGYVTIPCPIIHKTEMIDAAHAKVYGSFWILNYVRRGETLFNISGGEYPAVIMLENADGRWQVTAMEEAGEGEDYVKDIERFADGDQELADQYFAGADLGAEANQAIRTRFIKAYVEANGLNITAYQDYGWEPVELN